MDHYRDTAFCLTLWYAVLATIVAVLLIALNDPGLPNALLMAANLALLFALALVVSARRLTDRRILRGHFWRALPPQRRAAGAAGLRMARRALQETWLRFACGAAAVAIVLSALAYGANGVSASTGAQAGSDPAVWSGYRSARLLPTN